MGERKVLNKFYSWDFDPELVPRGRDLNRNRSAKIVIRMMLPFHVRCLTCGNFIGMGTKFNSRKEDIKGEDYCGITISRFYIKCTTCSAQITFKTDPKNAYVLSFFSSSLLFFFFSCNGNKVCKFFFFSLIPFSISRDYVCETGASRLADLWRDKSDVGFSLLLLALL